MKKPSHFSKALDDISKEIGEVDSEKVKPRVIDIHAEKYSNTKPQVDQGIGAGDNSGKEPSMDDMAKGEADSKVNPFKRDRKFSGETKDRLDEIFGKEQEPDDENDPEWIKQLLSKGR